MENLKIQGRILSDREYEAIASAVSDPDAIAAAIADYVKTVPGKFKKILK